MLCDAGKDVTRVVTGEDSLGDLVHRVHAVDRASALAAVANERRGIPSAPNLNGSEADLDGKVGPVTMATGEIETVAHLARAGCREEATEMIGVAGVVLGGNENLDRLADELFGVVAEQLADRRAREDDLTRFVDHDDRVGAGREDRSEKLSGLTGFARRALISRHSLRRAIGPGVLQSRDRRMEMVHRVVEGDPPVTVQIHDVGIDGMLEHLAGKSKVRDGSCRDVLMIDRRGGHLGERSRRGQRHFARA